ncbi:MAG: ABC transporter permease [Anaerolineae bacterium]|nr:ABC transporter permease [Anaerolineae bacterium]
MSGSTAYLIRRILYLGPLWLGLSLLAFGLGLFAPGDPAASLYVRLYGQPAANQTALDELRAEYGLNDPFLVRYGRWVAAALRGDLGNSYQSGRPVLGELVNRFGATSQIAVGGLFVAMLIAFPLGIAAARHPNRSVDLLARLFALIGTAMPAYWLAYLLILLFAVRLKWLYVSGTGTWWHLLLPALTLGLGGAASLSRLLRASLLEVFNQDYIRTARAKGLWEGRVVLRHALHNASIPVVTLLGSLFGFLLSGAVVVETVFAWPGIGRLIVDAISFRDYPVIQGFVLVTGTIFVLINLGVDLLYTVIDPRIRFSGPAETSHG